MRKSLTLYIVLSIALTVLSGCASVSETTAVKTTPTSLKYATSIDPMLAKVSATLSTKSDFIASRLSSFIKTCGLGVYTDEFMIKPAILKHVTIKPEITKDEQQLLNSYNACVSKLISDSRMFTNQSAAPI